MTQLRGLIEQLRGALSPAERVSRKSDLKKATLQLRDATVRARSDPDEKDTVSRLEAEVADLQE